MQRSWDNYGPNEMRSRKLTTPINPTCSFNTAYDGQGFVAMADGWYAACIITLDKLPRAMAVIDFFATNMHALQ